MMLTQKIPFLIRNGYMPEKGAFISQEHYNELSPEKQKEYIFVDCDGYAYYYKKSYYESISCEQIEEIAMYDIDEKITRIDKNINTIKNCILFALIMSVLSLIIYTCVIIAL